MRPILRLLLLAGLTLLLLTTAACQSQSTDATPLPGDTSSTGDGGEPNTVNPVDTSNTSRPELVGEITWDRNPATVVFRAEVAGGTIDQEFLSRNEVPLCTIYGDNRVVWTTTTVRNDDGVVFDFLPDETIRLFVQRITTTPNSIFDYQSGVDLLVPGEVEPIYERLTLFVNDLLHQTDAFGGWEYSYFRNMLDDCRNLSTTPVAFLPEEAWLSAQKVTYDPGLPSIIWDGDAAGLKLADLAAGDRRWLSGRVVAVLWDRIRSGGPDVQFIDGEETFVVAVEVPNITRSSPPRP